jgi:hypothetical protein
MREQVDHGQAEDEAAEVGKVGHTSSAPLGLRELTDRGQELE